MLKKTTVAARSKTADSLGVSCVVRAKIRSFLKSFSLENQDMPRDLSRYVLEEVERVLLDEVMKAVSLNQSRASLVLGVHRNTLKRRLHALKVQPKMRQK